MKAIISKSLHDSSLSISKRYFNWKKKVSEEDEDGGGEEEEEDNHDKEIPSFSLSAHFIQEDKQLKKHQTPKKKQRSVSKLQTIFNKIRPNPSHTSRVVGTLFGYRRGHVYFSLQENPKQNPTFLIQLSTPTSVLVREMGSGLVRIALECEKKVKKKKLMEEELWRTFCNGKKCGYAMKRECGVDEWKILKAVEPITMGAGVLPAASGGGGGKGNGAKGSEREGELMYMRARFERVVGSKDSEAFYMMNPDFSGGPELSVYLLRV